MLKGKNLGEASRQLENDENNIHFYQETCGEFQTFDFEPGVCQNRLSIEEFNIFTEKVNKLLRIKATLVWISVFLWILLLVSLLIAALTILFQILLIGLVIGCLVWIPFMSIWSWYITKKIKYAIEQENLTLSLARGLEWSLTGDGSNILTLQLKSDGKDMKQVYGIDQPGAQRKENAQGELYYQLEK